MCFLGKLCTVKQPPASRSYFVLPLGGCFTHVCLYIIYHPSTNRSHSLQRCNLSLFSPRVKDFYRWARARVRPPHNIRPVKGSVHVAVNRHMVDFALHSNVSRDFQIWLQKTDIPDETFFASLNYNSHLGIHGSFAGLLIFWLDCLNTLFP